MNNKQLTFYTNNGKNFMKVYQGILQNVIKLIKSHRSLNQRVMSFGQSLHQLNGYKYSFNCTTSPIQQPVQSKRQSISPEKSNYKLKIKDDSYKSTQKKHQILKFPQVRKIKIPSEKKQKNRNQTSSKIFLTQQNKGLANLYLNQNHLESKNNRFLAGKKYQSNFKISSRLNKSQPISQNLQNKDQTKIGTQEKAIVERKIKKKQIFYQSTKNITKKQKNFPFSSKKLINLSAHSYVKRTGKKQDSQKNKKPYFIENNGTKRKVNLRINTQMCSMTKRTDLDNLDNKYFDEEKIRQCNIQSCRQGKGKITPNQQKIHKILTSRKKRMKSRKIAQMLPMSQLKFKDRKIKMRLFTEEQQSNLINQFYMKSKIKAFSDQQNIF